jgi:hypothetical protein
MKIFCPECGTRISAEDLNLSTLLARCRKCDSVFSFADAARAESGVTRISGAEASVVIPRPPRMLVEDGGAVWSATWRWFTAGVLLMVLFCVAWDSFLVFWYSMAFRSPDVPWIMVVFPIVHVAVGVGVTYATIATIFNSTRVELTRSELSVWSGPLPWVGNQIIPTASIKQLSCRLSSERNRLRSNHHRQDAYALVAMLTDGSARRVVGGFSEVADAAFLQQQLENRLKIPRSALPAMV